MSSEASGVTRGIAPGVIAPRRRRGRAAMARQVLAYVVLVLLAVVAVGPLLWMLSTSLKTNASAIEYPPKWIPQEWKWSNYTSIFHDLPMGRWIFNSIFVSTTVVVLQLIICSMAAFAFSRLEFRGRDAIFYLFLGSMMIPYQVTLVPQYVLFSKLGWLNTYQGLILPNVSAPLGVFLMRQFFLTVPRELEDAARIDGAGWWRVYWQIILPLSRASLITFGVFSFIGMWGDFLWPLVAINSSSLFPVTLGLNFLNGAYTTDWPRLMAGDVITLVPLLVLYGCVQRYFVQGIAMTGLKG